MISSTNRELTAKRLEELGLKISFGKYVEESDQFISSSIKSRIHDIHAAFEDKTVTAIITVIGGFNCNQLLGYLDYFLIAANPKIFCGFSDITILSNAIFAKTGLITYSGPHYSSCGMLNGFEYSLDYFKKCLFSEKSFFIQPADSWIEDEWYLNQNDRIFKLNSGFRILQSGSAEGTIVGGNMCTFNLLHGTDFMPDLKDKIIFLEDDFESHAATFDRDLQSLIHQPGFKQIKGIIIGRFQRATEMTDKKLSQIISTKKELAAIPIIADVDFGHTYPQITFPIGGKVWIIASESMATIEMIEH